MVRSTVSKRIIDETSDITRDNVAEHTKDIVEKNQHMIENYKSYGFSNALIQDLINCIKPDERDDKQYGRDTLLPNEIEKIDFILTIVDKSTPEELAEYIAELVDSSEERYESNKKIAEKYKEYIGKTLVMLIEKDSTPAKSNENIIHLQTELIKINTYLQTCETFENNTAKDDENIKEHRFDFQGYGEPGSGETVIEKAKLYKSIPTIQEIEAVLSSNNVIKENVNISGDMKDSGQSYVKSLEKNQGKYPPLVDDAESILEGSSFHNQGHVDKVVVQNMDGGFDTENNDFKEKAVWSWTNKSKSITEIMALDISNRSYKEMIIGLLFTLEEYVLNNDAHAYEEAAKQYFTTYMSKTYRDISPRLEKALIAPGEHVNSYRKWMEHEISMAKMKASAIKSLLKSKIDKSEDKNEFLKKIRADIKQRD